MYEEQFILISTLKVSILLKPDLTDIPFNIFDSRDTRFDPWIIIHNPEKWTISAEKYQKS